MTRRRASSSDSARPLRPTWSTARRQRRNGSCHSHAPRDTSIGFNERRWCHDLRRCPIASPKLAYQTGPALITLRLSLLPACPPRDQVCLRPSCSPRQHVSPALSRRPLLGGTPPYSRGPRSGPGYVVPAHHHLIGPIRPTRGRIATSSLCDLYAMPSLCGSA